MWLKYKSDFLKMLTKLTSISKLHIILSTKNYIYIFIYQCNYPYHDPMPEDLELDDYRLGLYYGRIAEEEEWTEYELLHGPPIEYPPLPPPTYTNDDWGNWGLGEGIQVISTVPDFDFSTLSLKSR